MKTSEIDVGRRRLWRPNQPPEEGVLSLTPKVYANRQHGVAEAAALHIPRNGIVTGGSGSQPPDASKLTFRGAFTRAPV